MPKVEGLTQARCLGEAELMARELIALEAAQRIGDIDCASRFASTGEVAACLTGWIGFVGTLPQLPRQAVAEAELEQVGREMAGAEISLREISEFLGVPPPRVRRWVSA